MAYKDLKAPKKEMNMDEEFDSEMMDDLDLADEEMPSEETADLTAVSDEELMKEAKARGLFGDAEEDEDDDLEGEEPEMIFGDE